MNVWSGGEPGDGLGLDLIGTCLAHHLVTRGGDDGARIADRLPEARGIADLVSRPDAVRTASLPKWVMAAATADFASYTAVVVTRSWAMSDWSWPSVAPYSALPKPPKSALPSSTVIFEPRRSPCEIW